MGKVKGIKQQENKSTKHKRGKETMTVKIGTKA